MSMAGQRAVSIEAVSIKDRCMGKLFCYAHMEMEKEAIEIYAISNFAVAIAAAALDYLLGDPRFLLHPVQVIGWVVQRMSAAILSITRRPLWRWLAGIGLGLIIILGSGAGGWAIAWAAMQLHPFLGIGVEVIIVASCLAGRSLRQAAESVLTPLAGGDIEQARSLLGHYVGRDTASLDKPEILRAVLETFAENSVDGVTAPLFYALIGAMLPGFAIVAFPLAYKASSTLDSTIGYEREPYTDLGWFGAKTDDLLTWLPCRLTVLTLAFISGKWQKIWRVCWQDGTKDASPNSGWSEGAYAAILEVQLGGMNYYRGIPILKPLLGKAIAPITPLKIQQAFNLTRTCCLIWLGLAGIAIAFLSSPHLR
jgi:adenosylcobinamide-phosphate synthase